MPNDFEIAVSKLKGAEEAAAAAHPGSCSHAVWAVIKEYVPDQPYMTANALVHFLEGSPKWKLVQPAELAGLANQGILVVGGKTESGNGHVIAVYPGEMKPAGGYSYTKDGKTIKMPPRGLYARAMSTSLGGWAGAKSVGDKTVWDSWANDAKFKQVKFWRYDPEGK
ncbi:hypothetical protein [Parachitinimonas caeni]|uniref:Uncharacterized protein n=1 Tax=Parachitinimonas caeni TaxID=3031301 RepID=A0ABT7E0C3_9NEIS|nr:hypothetical protein [Parachitinimonas caeni]MDK2125764.1 hypothetical protein [Parachitinimonas caeni]